MFHSGETVRIKRSPKVDKRYWGAYAVIASRESLFVRKVFRTDYAVILVGSLEAATFKEEVLELH